MPSRHTRKIDVQESYYHIYNRGINKHTIFHDPNDYKVFLNLFKRYLSTLVQCDLSGRPYRHLYGKLELLCFCLMTNHFHLLIYQVEAKSMSQLMHVLLTSYTRYYNHKYGRRGPLFESRYKAILLRRQAHFQHISKYIHLNPPGWQTYSYSSIHYYLSNQSADWIRPKRIVESFSHKQEYINFLTNN